MKDAYDEFYDDFYKEMYVKGKLIDTDRKKLSVKHWIIIVVSVILCVSLAGVLLYTYFFDKTQPAENIPAIEKAPDENTEVNIPPNIIEPADSNIEENVEESIEETTDVNTKESIEQNAEENVDTNAEESIEQNAEENVGTNTEENVEVDVDTKADENAETTLPITHTIAFGDNLYDLAIRYGVTMEAIKQINGLENGNVINVGQTIIIPSADGVAEFPVSE